MVGVAMAMHGRCGLRVMGFGPVTFMGTGLCFVASSVGTVMAVTPVGPGRYRRRGRGRRAWLDDVAGFPGHDVCVAARKRGHGTVRVAPGCGRRGCVGQRSLRHHAEVDQGRGRRVGQGCIGPWWRSAGVVSRRVALGQRCGWCQQHQTSQQAQRTELGQTKWDAHGDLRTKKRGTALQPGRLHRKRQGRADAPWASGDQPMGGSKASVAIALRNRALASGSDAPLRAGASASTMGSASMAEWQMSHAQQVLSP